MKDILLDTYFNEQSSVQTGKEDSITFRFARSGRIFYHVVFWIMLFLLNAVSGGYLTGALANNIICFFVQLPFPLAVVYFNLYVLLPTFYYKGRLSPYLGWLLLS